MDGYLTLLFLFSGFSFSSCSHFPLRKYYYFSTQKTWTEAQVYCRAHHDDLATFVSMDEVNQLIRPPGITGWVWLGLKDDTTSWKGTLGNDSNSWKWATTGQTMISEFHNWKDGEPDYGNKYELCVNMDSNGKWSDVNCNSLQSFVCYTDIGQNQKTYHYIATQSTWEDALAYCRQHHTNLPVIATSQENTIVNSAKPNLATTWLALYRVPWTWSDGTPCTFKNWRSISPNYPYSQHCVNENDLHFWDDDGCQLALPFICHEVRKSQTMIKMKLKTAGDLIDPAINEQILQQLNLEFEKQGWTRFKLQWRIQPTKNLIWVLNTTSV